PCDSIGLRGCAWGVLSEPMTRDVDAPCNPHAISKLLQILHKFLKCPESAGSADDPDVKADVEHFWFTALTLFEEHLDRALKILKISAWRAPRIVGDELEVVAVQRIGDDQHGAARGREVVVRQIIGVLVGIVDKTEFLEDSTRVETWRPH